MIITTIDPITGRKILQPANHPYVVEGHGYAQTRIYFESEETRQRYLADDPQNLVSLAYPADE